MKTTGVLPEALVASISRFSRSETDAMPSSPRSGESHPDPIGVILVGKGSPDEWTRAVSNRRPRSRTIGFYRYSRRFALALRPPLPAGDAGGPSPFDVPGSHG
jgi:hypothetical protein